MYPPIKLQIDKLTIVAKSKDIKIDKVISINSLITEIIIPAIMIYEERAEIDFTSYGGRSNWNNRRFNINYEKSKEKIIINLRGAYFLTPNPMVNIKNLIIKLREHEILFHVTELDYQLSFEFNDKKKLYKEFLKSETGYCIKNGKEYGLNIRAYGKNKELMDSYSIGNTVYEIKLYHKSKQLHELEDKIKKETLKKYGQSPNLFRLELTFSRKSKVINQINNELLSGGFVNEKPLNELLAIKEKFKFSKNFIKFIKEINT